MKRRPDRGAGMREHRIIYRFEPGARPGPAESLGDRVVDVRKLLRTNMPTEEIAEALGVTQKTLATFVKRRQLCDLLERKKFINRMKAQEKYASEETEQ